MFASGGGGGGGGGDTGGVSVLTAKVAGDYAKFYPFYRDLCATWTAITDQAIRVDAGVGPDAPLPESEDAFVATQEQKSGKTLLRCTPALPAAIQGPSDIQAVYRLLPDNAALYKNTLLFASDEIATIQKQTGAALQGNPTQAIAGAAGAAGTAGTAGEGFAAAAGIQAKECTIGQAATDITCVFDLATAPGQPDVVAQLTAIQERLTTILAELPSLASMLQGVKAGVADLQSYQQKAQDGTLVNEIHVSS